MDRWTFFPRLALVNLTRNRRYYGPYLLSCGGVAAMYYILRFLIENEALLAVRGAAYLLATAGIGCFIVALFSLVILLYANSFVMKRRQRELGVYNILGLEKRHIALVMFWETLYCALIIFAGGIFCGILFSRAMLQLVVQMARIPVQFPFSVNGRAILETVELFSLFLALTLALNLLRLGRSRPVELLRSEHAGEREPRTKWLLALLGIAALGGGYYLAVAVKNPVEALSLFFLAVALVMLGTYCLFTAGSIAVLKRLRANKGFYYQTSHFTAVSGLLYRMKQNAVGLANICILSTMVLVTVSTTICLYVGLENSLREMFPYDIEAVQNLDRDPEDPMVRLERVRQDAGNAGTVTDLRCYSRIRATGDFRDGGFSMVMDQGVQTVLEVVTAEDYGRLTGRSISLAADEALAWKDGPIALGEDLPLTFTDPQTSRIFHIREMLAEPIRHNSTTLITSDEARLFLVVADDGVKQELVDLEPHQWRRQFRIQMNLAGTDAEKLAAEEAILLASDGDYGIIGKQNNAQEFYAMYGGFLFLGIFLGLLFLLVTVLIIYYKQISEGYQDQRRYQIMRQVGMTEKEVRGSIHSQILLVFFLPLGMAGLHILAAFPMLSKMLELFQLRDAALFGLCAAGTLLVFCAIYALVYGLTARSYDRIVGAGA